MFKTIVSAAKAMATVLTLVLAFTLNASAQESRLNNATKVTDNMKTELALNDAQYTKVYEINKTFMDKTGEARKNSTDKKATAQVVKGFNEEREAQLKTVLTEDQFKTYLAKKEAKKAEMKKRFSENKALGDPNAAPAIKSQVAPTTKQ